MAAMRSAELHKRAVARDGPLVPGAHAELNRRRIGTGGTDRAERTGDLRATGTGSAADLRNRLAVVRAGGVVVGQHWLIRLHALVPGDGTLQCQPADDPADQRGLDTPDPKVLAIGVKENVAGHTGVEEGDLDVVPVLLVDGPVPLQAMVEKFGLPADFVVGQ